MLVVRQEAQLTGQIIQFVALTTQKMTTREHYSVLLQTLLLLPPKQQRYGQTQMMLTHSNLQCLIHLKGRVLFRLSLRCAVIVTHLYHSVPIVKRVYNICRIGRKWISLDD